MNIKTNGLECTLKLSEEDYEGWIKTDITVSVPNFSGSFSCSVQKCEFQLLIEIFKKLSNSLGQELTETWCNMEDNIEFTFTTTQLGNIEGSYRFSPTNFSYGPVLSGEFESDQSYLNSWINQLTKEVTNGL